MTCRVLDGRHQALLYSKRLHDKALNTKGPLFRSCSSNDSSWGAKTVTAACIVLFVSQGPPDQRSELTAVTSASHKGLAGQDPCAVCSLKDDDSRPVPLDSWPSSSLLVFVGDEYKVSKIPTMRHDQDSRDTSVDSRSAVLTN